MRRWIVLIALIGLTTVFVRAQTVNPADVAGEFVIHLLADNYDAAYALFNPELQRAIPQTRLLALWSDVRFYGGTASSIRGIAVDGDTARVTVAFERAAYEVQVSVDAQSAIYRLFFRSVTLPPAPPEPTATLAPPTIAEAQSAVTVTVPAMPPASTASAIFPIDRAAIALDAARAIIDGNYDLAAARFHPQLTAVLPLDRLAAAWQSVTAARGAFSAITYTRVVANSPLVTVTAALENGTVEMQLSIDEQGRVFSLFFR
jgi:hypothetical protein